MERALKIHEHDNGHAEAEAHQTEEIIDAFNQVLESLDEILALAELAFPKDFQDAGH